MTNDLREDGLAIAEILVTIAIAVIFGLAAVSIYQTQVRALAVHSAMLDAADDARTAITFMTREVRGTGFDPLGTALSSPGTKGIRFASAKVLWLELDTDENGAIDPGAEDPDAESIVYSYDSATASLVRTVGGKPQTLVLNVPASGFSIRYFDSNGNELIPTGTTSPPTSNGYPALPPVVSQAASASPSLSASQRDQVAAVRLSVQVSTIGTSPPTNATLSARITLPSRMLERL